METLNRAIRIVRENYADGRDFSATSLFIATWHQVSSECLPSRRYAIKT